ncbi:unnamed protein product [Caenorhabditis sp. 36 PRJEB53466]|nr:unnamed protein product [Caenorhabditis sp. 36 PRJEB53466]
MDILDYIDRISADPPAPSRVASFNQNIHLVPEFLEWPNSETEQESFAVPEPSSLGPSTSGPSTTGIFRSVTERLMVYFPDTCTTITTNMLDLICSTRSDNDIQNELIELLGFELFDLVGEILENRNKISYEAKSKALEQVTEAKQNKPKT